MIIKARKITDASFAEISEVDKAACDLATIQHIELAKRALPAVPEVLPDLDPKVFTKDEQGFIKRMWSALFHKESMGEHAGSAGHGGYLVTDDNGQKHLPTERNGKRDHGLMGAAWAALHGGYRGNKYEGPDKDKAIARLTSMYNEESMDVPKAAGPADLAKSEILDLTKGWNDMEKDELIKELLDRIQKGSSVDGLLKGGRMSAGTAGHYGNMKKCFGKAAGFFGKAADSHPEDENMSDGMAHMGMGMQHMMKMDADMGKGPENGEGGNDDGNIEGGTWTRSPNASADNVQAGANIGNLIKSALKEQLEPIQEALKKAQEQAQALALENAKLQGQIEVWGAQPANAGKRPPLSFMVPMQKGDGINALVKAAGGADNPDLTITKADQENVRNGMSDGFRKALTIAKGNPKSVMDPSFNGSMGR